MSPAGVQAASSASGRLATNPHATFHLSDELERFEDEADLVRRRFKKLDPANRLLLETSASEVKPRCRRWRKKRRNWRAYAGGAGAPMLVEQAEL